MITKDWCSYKIRNLRQEISLRDHGGVATPEWRKCLISDNDSGRASWCQGKACYVLVNLPRSLAHARRGRDICRKSGMGGMRAASNWAVARRMDVIGDNSKKRGARQQRKSGKTSAQRGGTASKRSAAERAQRGGTCAVRQKGKEFQKG
jgi:hypothetical protein